jgi:NADH-quinone oxidoreductase subunit G
MATAGVSMHDGIGSNLYYHTRNGDILRTVPQDNDDINEAWISDRDRYGIHGLKNHQDRVLQPMIKENGQWRDLSWDDALATLVEQLKKFDGDEIALYTGNHSTTEEYHLLKQLFNHLGSHQHEHRIDVADFSDHDRLPRIDLKLNQVAAQQKVVLIGGHIRHEQPILNHKIRQAWLNGAQISSFGPHKFEQNYDLLHDFVANQIDWVKQLGSLAKSIAEINKLKIPGQLGEWVNKQRTDEDINHLAKQLIKDDVHALFVIGQISHRHPQANLIKALAAWVSQVTSGKIIELVPGANALGAQLSGLHAKGDIKRNQHRMNIIYQAEIQDFVDHASIKNALTNSDFSVAFNAYCDDSLKSRVDLILPIALLPEVTGSLVNNYGQRQVSLVAQKSPGETKPGWRVLRVLGNLLSIKGFDYEDINDVMAKTQKYNMHSTVINQDCKVTDFGIKGLVLYSHQGIYDGDALVRRSAPLQSSTLATSDTVYVSPNDLISIGFNAGDLVSVEQDGRFAELTLAVSTHIPEGSAMVNMGKLSALNLDASNLNVGIIGAQS